LITVRNFPAFIIIDDKGGILHNRLKVVYTFYRRLGCAVIDVGFRLFCKNNTTMRF